jgi:hypothetical protein
LSIAALLAATHVFRGLGAGSIRGHRGRSIAAAVLALASGTWFQAHAGLPIDVGFAKPYPSL